MHVNNKATALFIYLINLARHTEQFSYGTSFFIWRMFGMQPLQDLLLKLFEKKKTNRTRIAKICFLQAKLLLWQFQVFGHINETIWFASANRETTININKIWHEKKSDSNGLRSCL